MSENQNRVNHNLKKYDTMATEDLKEILRLDSEAPQGQELDTDQILYIVEVLAGREKDAITGKTAQESWKSFQQNYLPEEETCLPPIHEEKSVKCSPPWLRRLTAIAAIVALIVCLSATANAFSWKDLWNTVAKWAKETFSFVSENQTGGSEPSPDNTKEYTSLQQALSATNVTAKLVPTWIPEGYVLQDITIDENPMQRMYLALYKNGEKPLRITVQSYLMGNPEKVEIQGEPLEVYQVSETKYYILENGPQLRAAWIKDSYECYISGELTIAEIKTMIDSIGKG